MILAILLALVTVIVAIAFYFYFYFRRMLTTFGADVKSRWVKLTLILLTLLLVVASCQVMNFVSIIVLHVFFIGLIIQLLNIPIKRIFRKKYDDSVWKKIYGSGILPILLSAIVLVAGYFNLHNVVATNYTINTQKSIRAEGYRVALIADVHFGVSLSAQELKEKCAEISAQNVDIVVLCGDIVDNSTTEQEMHLVFDALGSIKSNYGVYYVYGNHDRPMRMLSSEYSAQALEQAIERSGITILRDEKIEINGELVLIGREDKSEQGRQELSEIVSDADKNNFILVADHQPNQYAQNMQAGVDLVVSGHTHGGQLFPLNIVFEVFGINDGVYGVYELSDNTRALVTSGFAGWSYPFKNAAPAEYVIVDILPN